MYPIINDKRKKSDNKIIALAGNPNVGKSTVFNELTGLKQHTGNWPGKTVALAYGEYTYKEKNYTLVDLPGTYSLFANSAEEEIARDFICENNPDVVVVVCDATCIERNLNLVLQILEITPNVVVCVNLMDEAKKKNIVIDINKLSEILEVSIVGCVARVNKGINKLCEKIENVCFKQQNVNFKVKYPNSIEKAISEINNITNDNSYKSRYNALRLISQNQSDNLREELKIVCEKCQEKYGNIDSIIASSIVLMAEGIANETIKTPNKCNKFDRKVDTILTNKITGIPIMILLLFAILWITIVGANYPSQLLAKLLFNIQDKLTEIFVYFEAPSWLHGVLVLGIYRVLAWIISVMLPPMAIFFPLFTLLEDFGYLPRVAFNLDNYFMRCGACGKQSLTMCMGLGCNAAGVIGCRIIDSPRERLIAILTNNFVPCNGRFPTLIAIITMFFVVDNTQNNLLSALMLSLIIIFGVMLTFTISKFLSKTILKGVPSSFTLELPPYRVPRIGRVIVTSIFDRTLFVLGRAVIVAAPAGLIIWIMANIYIGNQSVLIICSQFLDPFAKMFGMDGVILIAFILGFPANEIVIPIMIMAYTCTSTLVDFESLASLKILLVENGWTYVTAISVMLFSLCHWPCSTTCLTIKKETGSYKWTALSILIPTIVGLIGCLIFTTFARIFCI